MTSHESCPPECAEHCISSECCGGAEHAATGTLNIPSNNDCCLPDEATLVQGAGDLHYSATVVCGGFDITFKIECVGPPDFSNPFGVFHIHIFLDDGSGGSSFDYINRNASSGEVGFCAPLIITLGTLNIGFPLGFTCSLNSVTFTVPAAPAPLIFAANQQIEGQAATQTKQQARLEAALQQPGVGTEAHKIIGKYGFFPSADCRCVSKIEVMNERGVQWCKDNRLTILRWLEEASQKHNVPSYALARKLKTLPIWRACVMVQVIWPAIRAARAEK